MWPASEEWVWCNEVWLESAEQAKEKVQGNWCSCVPCEGVAFAPERLFIFLFVM